MANKPLRILVISNLPPHVLGGAENQVALLVASWITAGAHVEVIGHRIPNGGQILSEVHVPTHHIASAVGANRLLRALSYAGSLTRWLLRNQVRYDVIYIRGMVDAALTAAFLKRACLLKLPILVCPINARGAGDVAFVRGLPFSQYLFRLLDRHIDAVNLIAPAIGEDLANAGINTPQIHHVPNGIPLADQPRRTGVAVPRNIIWTGRFSVQKGLDVLLHAAAALKSSGLSFTLQLIGEGPEKPAIEGLARSLALGQQVQFVDQVPAESIRQLLLAADFFVLPSRYEGLSNAALEAMEAGLPIVCTDCGGIDRYLTPREGWVARVESVAHLSQQIAAALAMPAPELLAMGTAARALVEREFHLPTMAARNLKILRSLARATP